MLTFEQYMTEQYGMPPIEDFSWDEYFNKPMNKNLKIGFYDKYSHYKYLKMFGTPPPEPSQNTVPKFRVINKKS